MTATGQFLLAIDTDERVPLQLGVLGVGGNTDQPGKGMIDRSTRSTLRIVS
jgi:hypothetical protein